jgi:hypothetical protein
MFIYKSKPFWITGGLFAITFTVLFTIRIGIWNKILSRPQTLSLSSISEVSERNTWMNIFQNGRKIGFSHTQFSTEDTGFRLTETVYMRINTMGMIQDINLNTKSRLNPDFTLVELNFEISSGRFRFRAQGAMTGNTLHIKTNSAGSTRSLNIQLRNKPYLLSAIIDAVSATGLKPGEKYIFDVFDPATMSQPSVNVEIIGQDAIEVMGSKQPATKISLNFKGASQLVWIGEDGDILKQKGLLGISLVKTSRKDALDGLALESSQDLTLVASVPSNVTLNNVDQLETLKVEIHGVLPKGVQLHGGRQTFEKNVLIVRKESLLNLASDFNPVDFAALERIFLEPSAFIQSDHPKIQDLVKKILANDSDTSPLLKARKLLVWVNTHIEKRPVLSLPDALSTLENRIGDCNEHAVLLAALARAAGIPTRIEAGLVYLKGRFYYHAWNLLYLGRWVTADSLFGQLPADVSHLRFATGSAQQQLDLMGIIGKVQLTVIE